MADFKVGSLPWQISRLARCHGRFEGWLLAMADFKVGSLLWQIWRLARCHGRFQGWLVAMADVKVGSLLWQMSRLAPCYGRFQGWLVAMADVKVGLLLWQMSRLACCYGRCQGWLVAMADVKVGLLLWQMSRLAPCYLWSSHRIDFGALVATLPCGITGSVLRLVGLVSLHCDTMRLPGWCVASVPVWDKCLRRFVPSYSWDIRNQERWWFGGGSACWCTDVVL